MDSKYESHLNVFFAPSKYELSKDSEEKGHLVAEIKSAIVQAVAQIVPIEKAKACTSDPEKLHNYDEAKNVIFGWEAVCQAVMGEKLGANVELAKDNLPRNTQQIDVPENKPSFSISNN